MVCHDVRTYQDTSGAMPEITKGSLSFSLSAATMKSNCVQTLCDQRFSNFITPSLQTEPRFGYRNFESTMPKANMENSKKN